MNEHPVEIIKYDARNWGNSNNRQPYELYSTNVMCNFQLASDTDLGIQRKNLQHDRRSTQRWLGHTRCSWLVNFRWDIISVSHSTSCTQLRTREVGFGSEKTRLQSSHQNGLHFFTSPSHVSQSFALHSTRCTNYMPCRAKTQHLKDRILPQNPIHEIRIAFRRQNVSLESRAHSTVSLHGKPPILNPAKIKLSLTSFKQTH